MTLVPLKVDGTPDIHALNAEFSEEYLRNKQHPRWVPKATTAWMWARTVKCKFCRTEVPLLKTTWLSRKATQRAVLTLRASEATGEPVEFGVLNNVPVKGGNAAQRREHDKQLGAGTMSRAGAKCPSCGTINTMEDIRVEGQAKRLGAVLTAVVVEGQRGKEYRSPTPEEKVLGRECFAAIEDIYRDVPFGPPSESTPRGGGRGASRAFAVYGYGFSQWADLFTPRQHLALSTFLRMTRNALAELKHFYSHESWIQAVYAGLTIGMDRLADRQSTVCRWDNGYTKLQGTFTRFALPITWDYCEGNPFSDATGNYLV